MDIRLSLLKNYEQKIVLTIFLDQDLWVKVRNGYKKTLFFRTSSHIFFFDVFNDTGIIGLFSIIAIIYLLKTSSTIINFLNNNTNLNQCLFCFGTIVFFKLIIASDSYSEPLLITFLVFLILSFKKD